MLATCVLCLAAALVNETFLKMADRHNFGSLSTSVFPWMEEKMWRAQEMIEIYGNETQMQPEGRVRLRNRDFDWTIKYSVVRKGTASELYAIDLKVFWSYGGEERVIKRYAYAIYREKEKE